MFHINIMFHNNKTQPRLSKLMWGEGTTGYTDCVINQKSRGVHVVKYNMNDNIANEVK